MIKMERENVGIESSPSPRKHPSARLVVILIAFVGGMRIMDLIGSEQKYRSFFNAAPAIRARTATVLGPDSNTTTNNGNLRLNELVHRTKGDTSSRSISGNDERLGKIAPLLANCHRFASVDMTKGRGLGHLLTEVVFGMNFAQETNSTYVFNEYVWSYRGEHGSYDWLPEFLPLQKTEISTADLRNKKLQDLRQEWSRRKETKGGDNRIEFQRIEGQWDDVVERSKNMSCNVEFYTSLHKCCDDPSANIHARCWCTFASARVGMFERMKGRMREAFSYSNYTAPRQLLDTLSSGGHSQMPLVSIVWHVRVGDIVLNARKSYFWKIATQIADSFRNQSKVRPHVFVMGEGGKENILKSFPFLPDMCNQFFNSSCSYPEMDARETFYHMVKSDVLVTSGSSFSAVAAMLRSSGITLAAIPKERVVGIYKVSESLEIDKDGIIERIGVLEEYLELRGSKA